MNKSTAQIMISQYVRGLSNGSDAKATQEPSGYLSAYYQQGFDDGRNGQRRTIRDRDVNALGETPDPEGVELVRALREVWAKIDPEHPANIVYSKVMQGGDAILSQAFEPKVSFRAPGAPAPADTLPGAPPSDTR